MASEKSAAPTGAFSKLEGSLKLRYLGIGFVWAWIYGSYETFAVYPDRTGIGINADASWIASATVVVVVLFALGFLLGRKGTLPPIWVGVSAAVAAGVGTLLSSLPFPSEPVALIMGSGALTGFGTGALYVLWGQALARLDTESAELAIPAASLIMLTCALVLPYLPSFIGIAATASLPVASGIMLLLTYHDVNERDECAEEGTEATALANDKTSASQHRSTGHLTATSTLPSRPTATALGTFARIAGLLFLSYFVIGCSGALQPNADAPFIVWGIDFSTLIGACCGIGLLVCVLLFSTRPNFDGLFRLIAPVMVAAVALLPWSDLWAVFLSTTLVSIADTTLTIAAVLFVITAAKRKAVNAALGIGITQGSLQLGVLLGNLGGSALSDFVAANTTGLFTVTLGLLVLFSLGWLLYPTHRSHRAERQRMAAKRDGHSSLRDSASCTTGHATHPASTIGAPDGLDGIDATCQALTEAHGLSGRESEILGYLARGRSQPYIREELVLSKNTVATHVKHIYQKLDVHSRQELLDLFE